MSILLKRLQRNEDPPVEDSSAQPTVKPSTSEAKPQANSLLQDAIVEDYTKREQASDKIAHTEALKPSDDEIKQSDQLIKSISRIFGPRISEYGLTDDLRTEITCAVNEEVDRLYSDYEARERMKKLVLSSMFGLGPIEPYMRPDSAVSDIIVQRFDSIFIEDENGLRKVDAQFNSEQHLRNVIERIVQKAGRQINLISPAVDAKLEDGSRVHATLPPVTPDGATLTIRRFNNRKLEPDDYLELKTLNLNILDFLAFAVRAKLNIAVSGGTGSGKTSLLNMLSSYIPDNELIITIEDNCELQLKQPNVRRMEARSTLSQEDVSAEITIQDLVRHSLRMRPDRIIVGEVRDGSIVDMLSAMSTGHEGSMTTIHSDSPQALFDSRLPTLFSQYNVNFSKETQSLMCAEAIHLVVQISRERDFSRKITYVSCVKGIDPHTNRIILEDIFVYSRKKRAFEFTGGGKQRLLEILSEKGIDLPDWLEELYCNYRPEGSL